MVTGKVLTTTAPGRSAVTQAPSLLISAVEPSGFSAPTVTSGGCVPATGVLAAWAAPTS